jgi:predicted MFS family arabinose efflux permease
MARATVDPVMQATPRHTTHDGNGGHDGALHHSEAAGSDESTSNVRARGAVLSLTLCVMVLIASEFMPVSLLTPIASDLGITEGQAGQAISISGVFAVVTSLLIAAASQRLDRRRLLLSLTGVTVLSGVLVAAAPNYALFMAGRALLGIGIGGFWSMSTATIMRLVPAERVAGALAVLNGGNALAATVAAPLGSFAGGLIGWRGAFFCVVPLALATLAWQFVSLPSMPPNGQRSSQNVFLLLRRVPVAYGMAAMLLLFMGQFALFTYLRPFLESVTKVDVSTLSLLLLGIGLSGLAGNALVGPLLQRRLTQVVTLIPLAMAAVAVSLIVFGGSVWAVAALLVAWGLFSTPAPVGWGTWLTRTLPDDAEAGGGLMVATIQFAITLGAFLGGMAFDAMGHQSTFSMSAALLCAGGLLAFKAGQCAQMHAQVPAVIGATVNSPSLREATCEQQ